MTKRPLTSRIVTIEQGRYPWRPVVDGTVLRDGVLAATRAGELNGVAALVGTNANEFDLLAMGRALDRGDPTVEQMSHLADSATLDRILDGYRALYPPRLSPRQIRIQLMTAEEYWIPTARFAETHAAAGGETWMYRFDWRPTWHPARLRASHMMELPFVFDAFDRGIGRALTLRAGSAEHFLSQRVRAAWTSFVRDHQLTAEPAWSTYGAERHVMTIDHEWRQRADPLAAERRLWDGAL